MKFYQWNGLYYDSYEECSVERSENEIVIKSSITGKHGKTEYHANYTLKTNSFWQTTFFEIEYDLNQIHHQLSGIREKEQWVINDQIRKEFKNCIDIDITLTPLTNSLPINRLNFQLNKSHQIDVLYVNVLENQVYPVKQQYIQKSKTVFNFQNVPNDFEADITVDSDGFVTEYPKLFKRIKS